MSAKKDLSEGKKFFLEKLGIEIVCLRNYNQIYEQLID